MITIRPILQSEAGECGLACLAMIANSFGCRLDLGELRRRFAASLKGSKLASLIRYAETLGLNANPLRLELNELSHLRTPCILHWDLNHFVVLQKTSRKSITIIDPAVGSRTLSISEASRHFTGIALELSPTPGFRPFDNRKRLQIRELARQTPGLRAALIQVFLLAVALETFAIAAPFFNQLVIDEVVVSSDREYLHVLAIGFGLLLLTQIAIELLHSWMVLKVSLDVRLQWLSGLFTHLLRLPAGFFERRHLGDIVSRFSSINTIQNTVTMGFVAAILDGTMAIATLAMMLAYSTSLTLIVVSTALAYGILRSVFYSPLRTASAERLVLASKENSHFLETLRAIVPLKLSGQEATRRTRWQQLMLDVTDRDLKIQKLELLFTTSATLVTGGASLLLLTFGAGQVMEHRLSIGMLMAFNSYAGIFSARVNALINHGIQLKMLELHSERLADIALTPPEPEAEEEMDLSRLLPRITLRNVSFRYAEGDPWIMRWVSLEIAAGESVVFVGPSGCGKSTLLKLLLGLLEPTEGEVLIDGVPIQRLGRRNYQKLVGAVAQDDCLLAGSIAENISFFDPEAIQANVEASARIAAIHDEIISMPMGYQTLVGDMGSSLSSGQKQRLLLARALYKKPCILVLDEGTSHLDPANEQRILNAIEPLQITRIQVAHRAETIASAHRVVRLQAADANNSYFFGDLTDVLQEESTCIAPA